MAYYLLIEYLEEKEDVIKKYKEINSLRDEAADISTDLLTNIVDNPRFLLPPSPPCPLCSETTSINQYSAAGAILLPRDDLLGMFLNHTQKSLFIRRRRFTVSPRRLSLCILKSYPKIDIQAPAQLSFFPETTCQRLSEITFRNRLSAAGALLLPETTCQRRTKTAFIITIQPPRAAFQNSPR